MKADKSILSLCICLFLNINNYYTLEAYSTGPEEHSDVLFAKIHWKRSLPICKESSDVIRIRVFREFPPHSS